MKLIEKLLIPMLVSALVQSGAANASNDPITADPNTGANFNRYYYANNNPYKFKDPDGRLPIGPEHCENLQVGQPPLKITLPTPSGIVTSGFGVRTHPVTGQTKLHNGTDFKAPLATKIRSTQDGTIASVNSGGPGGTQIMVRNDDGSMSGYAHTAPANGIKSDARVTHPAG